MRWLIFALGVALALGGAASIVSGVPYIRIESGWTEVIAGTTALSGGIVTLGLGAVLSALRSLEMRLVAGQSSIVVDESSVALRTTKPLSSPLVETGLASDEAAIAPSFAAGRDTTPTPTTRPLMGRLKSKLSTMGTLANERPEPSVNLVAAIDPSSAAPSTRRDRDEASALYPPEGNALDLAPRRSSARPSAATLTRGEADVGIPSLIPSQNIAAVETGPGTETQEAPTVVGRYESGGATYVLFSDGTIEVETEAGTHRFASMEELKAYIDQQDASAVS